MPAPTFDFSCKHGRQGVSNRSAHGVVASTMLLFLKKGKTGHESGGGQVDVAGDVRAVVMARV
jgi:hypothetical protein